MFGFLNKKIEKEIMDDWDKKYPIGGKLKYHGKKLIIRKNWTVFLGGGIEPWIIADYVDNNGKINQIEFSEIQANELFGR